MSSVRYPTNYYKRTNRFEAFVFLIHNTVPTRITKKSSIRKFHSVHTVPFYNSL